VFSKERLLFFSIRKKEKDFFMGRDLTAGNIHFTFLSWHKKVTKKAKPIRSVYSL
jgi:hypothetical protein